MTVEELASVRRWKCDLSLVSREEMLHLTQVANLLTAIGGAPHLERQNFPMPEPFCDGTHARAGFSSDKNPERTPDGVRDYAGTEITVHFNRLQCASAERCSEGLAAVFRTGKDPWIDPDRAAPEEIIRTIARCPSGALRYTTKGETGPAPPAGPPQIAIIENGPYAVEGIALTVDDWCDGATRDRYTLWRCGASKNKPFCDGSHWAVGFTDPKN